MPRYLAVALGLVLLAAAVAAQVPAPAAATAAKQSEAIDPDKLLSPTSQLYVRWDGIELHNEAYKNSFWGPVMAGPTGDSVREVIARGQKLVANKVLAEPLLQGKSPDELRANLADLKKANPIVELLAAKGVIVAAEMREPRPSLKGIGDAIGGLLGGKAPGPETLFPDAQLLVVVPNVGDGAETLNAAIRLAFRKAQLKIEPFNVSGRKGFQFQTPKSAIPLYTAWWSEGKHFILYAGTARPEAMIGEIAANQARGGVTGHPLYQRCNRQQGYESVTRGFVDAARVLSFVKGQAAPFVPGLATRLDDLGLSNLKAVVFNSGFAGKESRGMYEVELAGEQKGLARVLKQEAITLKDLPPLPPDVSRFSALRVDPEAAYQAGIMGMEAMELFDSIGESRDEGKSPSERINSRRDEITKEFDKQLGVNLREEVVPFLGDKVVLFQSPTEGLSVFGTVVCVSLKNPEKVREAADKIARGMENIVGAPVKLRSKLLRGVEIRELYSREFGIITPAYAIVGDWLVVSAQPQCIQGLVLRAKGELASWKPDAQTAARLAKIQSGCGLQYCDPRSTVQNLACVGPLALGTLGFRDRFSEKEMDYDPIDVGLAPNGHELSKHLFPNLTVTRIEGKTIKIEVNESLSLPLEVIGLEPLAFAALTVLVN